MKNNYKLLIGSHVGFSAPEYFVGSVKEALSYGSNCFMIYTGAPQNTIRKPLDEQNILLGKKMLEENNIDLENIVIHAPYIINLCSENPSTRQLAVDFLEQEIIRAEQIGVKYIVLHPGSKLNQPLDIGLNQVIDGLNYVFSKHITKVVICIETMAGKGSEVGTSLQQLKQIINGVNKSNNIAVCLDTCHLNDAGYNMSDFDEYLNQFDKEIGLNKIKVIHLNDSKNPLNSHKDRHENIGYGYVGANNLIEIAWHEKLNNIPKILETPYVVFEKEKKHSLPPYKHEIKIIKNKKWFDFKKEMENDL